MSEDSDSVQEYRQKEYRQLKDWEEIQFGDILYFNDEQAAHICGLGDSLEFNTRKWPIGLQFGLLKNTDVNLGDRKVTIERCERLKKDK